MGCLYQITWISGNRTRTCASTRPTQGSLWSARMVYESQVPSHQRCHWPTRQLTWEYHLALDHPFAARGPWHGTGAQPLGLPTDGESFLGREPGQQGDIGDAGLAPNMHHWELTTARHLRGERVAVGRGCPGGVPFAVRAGVSGSVGVWTGPYLTGLGCSTPWTHTPCRPERSGPPSVRQCR